MSTNEKSSPDVPNPTAKFFPDFSTFSLFDFFSKFLRNSSNDEIHFRFFDQISQSPPRKCPRTKSLPQTSPTRLPSFFPTFPLFHFLTFFQSFCATAATTRFIFDFLTKFPRVHRENVHERKVFPRRPQPDCQVFSRLFHFFTF